jgi:hypothetical protein
MFNRSGISHHRPLRRSLILGTAAAVLLAGYSPSFAVPISGDLIVSRSVYSGDATTVTIGQALPGGGVAVVDGSYPGVWANETPDPSFGVTAPIYLDRFAVTGSNVASVGTLSIPTSQIVTSFSSKSELGLLPSTDGQSITFMGYPAPINTLDVSNSNTPGHVDSTNPVALTFQRAVAQVSASGGNSSVLVTPVNTYSGNNGRAAILDSTNNQYFLAGNAGNGASPEPINIVNNTGVQIACISPCGNPETQVVGVQQGTPGAANGYQFGFSVAQSPYNNPADKSGKDDNFRGLTIFNNTVYVTKGSGGNGINTVYQVGTAGTLPTVSTASSTAINILPGFSTTLASSKTGVIMNPFGIWFANATTLYVADEGNGKATNPNAGLQKWVFESDNTWHNVYTLTNGLNRGVPYSVPGYPTTLNPATDGLRSLTGRVNSDGTVTLFAATSTTSASKDQGADPNMVVTITDTLAFLTPAAAAGESFTTVATANYGEVLRGVAFVPLSSELSPVISGLVFNRRTQTFQGTIQLTNNTGRSLAGPLQMELQNLVAGVTLMNPSGSDNGNPYITIAPGGLAAGDSITVPVSFSDPTKVGINYTVQVFSGNF